MPTYVYACDSCGARFEQFQSFKDEPLRECPRCAHAIRRVFQPVGIVFKGAGWYINDSRGSSSTSSVAEGDKGDKGEAKTDTGDKSETKTDTGDKGEAKAESKTDKAEPSEKSSVPVPKPTSSAAPASDA